MLFVSNVICIQGMRSKTPVIKLVYWFAWTTLIFGDKVLSLGLGNTTKFDKIMKCVENLWKIHFVQNSTLVFITSNFLIAVLKIYIIDEI